jgi:hypothetical protein
MTGTGAGPGGPAPARPPVTLASLIRDWGDAYTIGYDRDWWTAARRDGRAVLYARALATLESALDANYRTRPVPRTCDPPQDSPGDAPDSDPGGLAEDESFLLAALAEAFPAWAISYSYTNGTWTARTRKKTIRHESAVLLCAAMVLAERRHRQSPAG